MVCNKKNFRRRNCKIGKTTFWNNSEVKINNKVILYKDWLENFEHIFDFRINNYYTFDQMKFLYGINNGDFKKYIMQ